MSGADSSHHFENRLSCTVDITDYSIADFLLQRTPVVALLRRLADQVCMQAIHVRLRPSLGTRAAVISVRRHIGPRCLCSSPRASAGAAIWGSGSAWRSTNCNRDGSKHGSSKAATSASGGSGPNSNSSSSNEKIPVVDPIVLPPPAEGSQYSMRPSYSGGGNGGRNTGGGGGGGPDWGSNSRGNLLFALLFRLRLLAMYGLWMTLLFGALNLAGSLIISFLGALVHVSKLASTGAQALAEKGSAAIAGTRSGTSATGVDGSVLASSDAVNSAESTKGEKTAGAATAAAAAAGGTSGGEEAVAGSTAADPAVSAGTAGGRVAEQAAGAAAAPQQRRSGLLADSLLLTGLSVYVALVGSVFFFARAGSGS